LIGVDDQDGRYAGGRERVQIRMQMHARRAIGHSDWARNILKYLHSTYLLGTTQHDTRAIGNLAIGNGKFSRRVRFPTAAANDPVP
jgi:hypothetical protein